MHDTTASCITYSAAFTFRCRDEPHLISIHSGVRPFLSVASIRRTVDGQKINDRNASDSNAIRRSAGLREKKRTDAFPSVWVRQLYTIFVP